MGQVMACCTGAEREATNDDTIYFPPPQEIGQPWIGKFNINEGKAVLAVDLKEKIDQKYMCSTEEEIAQERMKIISSIFEERRGRPCV